MGSNLGSTFLLVDSTLSFRTAGEKKWALVCKAAHSARQCVAQNQALWKFPNGWGKVAGLSFRSCDLSYLSLTPLLFFFASVGAEFQTFSSPMSTDAFPKMTDVCSEKQSMPPLPQVLQVLNASETENEQPCSCVRFITKAPKRGFHMS